MKQELSGDQIAMNDIAATLESLCEGPEVARLAVIGIGGVLLRHHRTDGSWHAAFDAYHHEIRHVIDWLASSVNEGDAWLRRLDDTGRPLKLAKMHSIPQLVREADKAFAKKMQRVATKAVLPSDERLVMDLRDGFRVVRMMTPEALDRESAEMRHCIGLGSYDSQLAGDRIGLYSLRDSSNKPHATMEIDYPSKSIVQLRGKQNAMPTSKYLDLLGPFIVAQGFHSDEIARLGYVLSKHGNFLHASSIPDNTEFDGMLKLRCHDMDDADIRVPDGLKVNGDIDIGSGFEGLFSKRTTVSGNVYARGIRKADFAKGFVFGGGLYLGGSDVMRLPDDLTVHGDLDLRDMAMSYLPRRLIVTGNLLITGSRISGIPSDTTIGGDLVAQRSELSRLHEGGRIGGSVFLDGTTGLEEIPANFRIGRNLMLGDCAVRYIAEGVVVGGRISMNADIADETVIADSVVSTNGLYFRPGRSPSDLNGRTLTADEFRSLDRPSSTRSAPSARFMG